VALSLLISAVLLQNQAHREKVRHDRGNKSAFEAQKKILVFVAPPNKNNAKKIERHIESPRPHLQPRSSDLKTGVERGELFWPGGCETLGRTTRKAHGLAGANYQFKRNSRDAS
jgi:hypothetical protein